MSEVINLRPDWNFEVSGHLPDGFKIPHKKEAQYLGVSTPPNELVGQIQSLGWEVQKIQWSGPRRAYEAKGKNEHGEQKVGYGPDQASALAQLLMTISRQELIRSSSIDRAKFGLYTHKLKEIAQAYLKAPVYDPKIAGYFLELGQDSTNRAKHIRDQIDVKIVDGPEPYDSAQDMFEDIRKGKLKVTRAGAGHPVWSHTQVINFRIVHDVMGHYESGGDFSWAGENLASRAHARLLSSTAQVALFTECIGQAAYTTHHRNFGPQKIAALPEFFDPLGEGKTQHAVHPSQMFVKGPMPGEKRPDSASVTSRVANTLQDPNLGYRTGIEPQSLISGGEGAAYLDHGDPLEGHKTMDSVRSLDTGWHSLKSSDGSFDRDRAKQAVTNAFRSTLLSDRKDPQWGAIHYQDIAHVPPSTDDPKIYWDTLESKRRDWHQAKGLSSGWGSYQKLVLPLQGALLQLHPEIGFDDIAEETQRLIHDWRQEEYQRIESEDSHKSSDKQKSSDQVDRKVNDALGKRIEKFLKDKWDRKTDISDRSTVTASGPKSGLSYIDRIKKRFQGVEWDDQIHRSYGDDIRSRLGDGVPDDHAAELMGLYADIALHGGESATNEDIHDAWAYWTYHFRKNPDHKSLVPYENLDTRTQDLDDDYTAAVVSVAKERFDKSSATKEQPLEEDRYRGFSGSGLKSIAEISHNSDHILNSALRDIYEHNGTGHHFRAQVLNLGIPGVGPKTASWAWTLLHPKGSQLATIDSHIMSALGHNHDKEMNPRDYFKFERELMAARDASGYSHLPLGAFQLGLWDHKQNGKGVHTDHSHLRVLDPTSHHHVDWSSRTPEKESWDQEAPDWWQNTQGARDKVAHDWDKSVGSNWPQGQIPFQVTSGKKSEDPKDELCAAFDVPREFKTRLPEIVEDLKKDIDLTEIQDPDEYHITLVYAPEGYKDRDYHKLVHDAPGNIPFTNPRLGVLDGNPDGDFPVVIRFDSAPGNEIAEDLMDAFEDLGADVSRYEGGWKPHITLGYSAKRLPKTLEGKKFEDLEFQAKSPRLLVPRGLRRESANITPPTPGAPWVTDTNGDRLHGDPKDSIMQHALKSLGVYGPWDVWESRHDGGRST